MHRLEAERRVRGERRRRISPCLENNDAGTVHPPRPDPTPAFVQRDEKRIGVRRTRRLVPPPAGETHPLNLADLVGRRTGELNRCGWPLCHQTSVRAAAPETESGVEARNRDQLFAAVAHRCRLAPRRRQETPGRGPPAKTAVRVRPPDHRGVGLDGDWPAARHAELCTQRPLVVYSAH